MKSKDSKDTLPAASLYKIIVRPREAKAYSGMIELPSDTQEAQQASTMVGEVVDMGDLAYQANTPGLNYRDDKRAPKLGSWVAYSKYAGQLLKLRNSDGSTDKIIIIADSDIHAVFADEKAASRVVGYVE